MCNWKIRSCRSLNIDRLQIYTLKIYKYIRVTILPGESLITDMTMTFQVIQKIISIVKLCIFRWYFRTWNTDPNGFYGPNISIKDLFHYFHQFSLCIWYKKSQICWHWRPDADAISAIACAKWIENLAHELGLSDLCKIMKLYFTFLTNLYSVLFSKILSNSDRHELFFDQHLILANKVKHK